MTGCRVVDVVWNPCSRKNRDRDVIAITRTYLSKYLKRKDRRERTPDDVTSWPRVYAHLHNIRISLMASYAARPSRNTNSPEYCETYRFLTDDDNDDDDDDEDNEDDEDDDDLSSIFFNSLFVSHVSSGCIAEQTRRTRVP